MATTVWHGHLTFGLVSIPVRMYKAARSEKIRLNHLYRQPPPKPEAAEVLLAKEGPIPGPHRLAIEPGRASATVAEPSAPAERYSRVRQNLYVPPDEMPDASTTDPASKPIARTDTVKGFEFEKNRYVVLEGEDLKKITPQTTTEMEILEFVKLAEIDPVHFETSYYMAPDEAGEKAYALLFQAMRETQFVAIAEVAMHRKEHVMVLRPGQHGLLAHTMFYSDEIRQDQEHRAQTSLVVGKELQMAKLLVGSLAAPFDASKYKDKYREKLHAVIASKMQGRPVEITQAAPNPAQVVDILQALEKSLQLVRKPPGHTTSTLGESAPQRKTKQRPARG